MNLYHFLPGSVAHAQLNQITPEQCGWLQVNCRPLNVAGAGGADPWVLSLLLILSQVLSFMAVLALIMVIVAGILYMTSAGNEKRTEQAKKAIIYTVIGLAIIAFSGLFVNFVIGALF